MAAVEERLSVEKPSKAIGTSKKCSACKKTVYPLEALQISNIFMHETCFKCSMCKTKLKLATYKALNGLFYCPSHFQATLNRLGGDLSLFSSDTPEGYRLLLIYSLVSTYFRS